MATQYHYASVSEALEELKKIGFIYDFNIHEEEIVTDPDGFIVQHVITSYSIHYTKLYEYISL